MNIHAPFGALHSTLPTRCNNVTSGEKFAIESQNVSYSVKNEKGNLVPILNNCSLKIPSGQFWMLLGPNGCGKSTLFTDERMQLRKQIDEMIKAGKFSQFIKELKQNDKPKAPKKGETAGKERPLAILMVQPWDRVSSKGYQTFLSETTISFPTLGDKDGTEGPMIIKAEIGGRNCQRYEVAGSSQWKLCNDLGPSHSAPEVGKILEEMIKVAIHLEYPKQTIAIGSTLTEKGRKELCICWTNSNVLLETQKHDECPTTRSGAPSKCPGRVLTYQTKEEGASTGKE
ncbi:reverse transcriptase domain-containing protein [Tanacetum coccineum]